MARASLLKSSWIFKVLKFFRPLVIFRFVSLVIRDSVQKILLPYKWIWSASGIFLAGKSDSIIIEEPGFANDVEQVFITKAIIQPASYPLCQI
jgi:hypothetical protein